MSLKPCRFRSLRMCSIMGLFKMGTMGLGTEQVKGRSRVPSPPAMITAFMDTAPFPQCLRCELVAVVEHLCFPLGQGLPVAFHSPLGNLFPVELLQDRKSTRLNSSHVRIS